MTPQPHTLPVDATMERAHEVMREFKIHHLPVVDNGATVGILSLGDLHLLETLKGVVPSEVPIEDAMTADPLSFAPSAAVREVAGKMIERGIGSVLVTQDQQLLGIFTRTDALAALVWISEELHTP